MIYNNNVYTIVVYTIVYIDTIHIINKYKFKYKY